MASAYAPPGDPTDVVGRRVAALLIDAVLLGAIGLMMFAVLKYRAYSGVHVDACAALRKVGNHPLCLKVGSHVFLWHGNALRITFLVVLFAAFLDGVVLQSITGSTVGKLCVRLSVVDEHGQKAHPLRIFGRWLFLVVDLGFFLVGFITALATHPHRRLGDFAFGTYVVAMRSVGRPIVFDESDGLGTGSPANWTAPPVPSPVKTPLASSSAALPVPLKTPPGTAPTTPGQWGAVARPAPLVRSPQWASPPPSQSAAPPAVIESASSPKWAAPPSAHESDASSNSQEPTDEVEAEPEVEPESSAERELDAESEEAGPEEPGAEDQEPEAAEAEIAEPGAGAGADVEVEVDVESEEPEEPEAEEPEAEPELSEWSPVATARERRRARTNRAAKAAASGADDSWWDEALSSGDSDTEADSD